MNCRIIALLIFICSSAALFGQKDKKITEATVTRSGVEGKVHFLASDEMRGRDTPSPELNMAARFLATNLMQSGVKMAPGADSYLQPVSMVMSTPPSSGSFAVGDSVFDFKRDMIMLSGGAVSLNAGIVFAGYGSDEDFESLDVAGKIVVTKAGVKGDPNARAAFREGVAKAQRAQDKGALAIVELYNFPQPTWKLLQYYLSSRKVALDMGEEDDETFPRIWLEDLSNEKAGYITPYAGMARLEIAGAVEEKFTTYNVVGVVEGTDPKLKEEYVIYSAHYDHVGVGEANAEGDSIFNGTRDNAIGSMTVLEAAQNIAKNPTKRSSLFIFFTGEEKGLLGSEWYTSHPMLPLEKMVYCFNSDNAGYNNTEIITIVGLNRTSVANELITAGKAFGLEVNDDPVPDQNLYDRSDHVNFAREGIPALMFTLGITDFDDQVLKYYHQQADNPDSVDYDYLYKFTQAYVYACRLIGNKKETPVWTAGDKYEEAGKALYGK
jgi:hypothetical protein